MENEEGRQTAYDYMLLLFECDHVCCHEVILKLGFPMKPLQR